MYQNKNEDRVTTPAHLLLAPLDSATSVNLLNFRSIGTDTLKESSAFSKIRNATKTYNSHLVCAPSVLTYKYKIFSNLYSNSNNYLQTSSFGLKRPHNLASPKALGNSFSSTILDEVSFLKFTQFNLSSQFNLDFENRSMKTAPLLLSKHAIANSSLNTLRIANVVTDSTAVPVVFTRLNEYPSFTSYLNDNSDKNGLRYPIFKLLNFDIVSGTFLNNRLTYLKSAPLNLYSFSQKYSDSEKYNLSSSSKHINSNNFNSKILLGDQSVRNLPNLIPVKSNLNFSKANNTIVSNFIHLNSLNDLLTPLNHAYEVKTHYLDQTLFNTLGSSRSFISSSYPAVLSSSSLESNSLNYDSSKSFSRSLKSSSSNLLTSSVVSNEASTGDVFIGSREKTPKAVNSTY